MQQLLNKTFQHRERQSGVRFSERQKCSLRATHSDMYSPSQTLHVKILTVYTVPIDTPKLDPLRQLFFKTRLFTTLYEHQFNTKKTTLHCHSNQNSYSTEEMSAWCGNKYHLNVNVRLDISVKVMWKKEVCCCICEVRCSHCRDLKMYQQKKKCNYCHN